MRVIHARVLIAGFSLIALACGDDDGGAAGDPSTAGTSGNGSGSASGPCAAEQAGMACGSDCSFAPAGVDCARACANIATTCAEGACGTHCTGINQDQALCTVACEATKSMYCTNETFGCWASESTCDGVGTCFGEATDRTVQGGSNGSSGEAGAGGAAGEAGAGGAAGVAGAGGAGEAGAGGTTGEAGSGGTAGTGGTDVEWPPPELNCTQTGRNVAPLPEGADAGQPGPVVAFGCPAGCSDWGPLWGTDVYTDDSWVCVAAIHAGVIEEAAGGIVHLRYLPGQDSYEGTERNGVTSSNWGVWAASFGFVD